MCYLWIDYFCFVTAKVSFILFFLVLIYLNVFYFIDHVAESSHFPISTTYANQFSWRLTKISFRSVDNTAGLISLSIRQTPAIWSALKQTESEFTRNISWLSCLIVILFLSLTFDHSFSILYYSCPFIPDLFPVG